MEISKLPDSEYEIMDYIWEQTPPVTSAMVMENVGKQKQWKAQTLLTLLSRLCDRGYINGKADRKTHV